MFKFFLRPKLINIRFFHSKNPKKPVYKRFSPMQAAQLLNKDDCKAKLKEFNINFILHTHESVPTMVEVVQKVKLDKAPHIKNLLYYDKKDNFYLVLALNDTKVEKSFWRQLDVSPGNVRLSKDEDIERILGTKKGTVNPFALLNDKDKKVKHVIIDKHLFDKHEFFAFHPMDNTETVELSKADFLNYLSHVGKSYHAIALDEVVEEKPKDDKKEDKKKQDDKKKQEEKKEDEHQTKLCIEFKKAQNFPKWYSQVIIKAELIEYYDVSGCYILRPWAYSIWEKIQAFFDRLIKLNGVDNAYFPLFVSEKALTTEKDHVEGFAPEVAWVTKYGTTDLDKPIAIRPTSETIMYPSYSKWITSHRDLPLKLNQWTNVVRWEFKHPTPFIRTREFLWQEGHTAHATFEEAEEQTYHILDLYRKVYEELLAVPVIKGVKSENEKFAGGLYTTTVETFIPCNGRAIQAATSHNLGQNFSKMFDIKYLDKDGKNQLAWQTSWGLTTRSIGVVVMVHADDIGLVLPPKVARYQVVLVPVLFKGKFEAEIQAKCKEISNMLASKDVRAHVDDRDVYTPGWKYSHWELKGVPLRMELGPKDFEKQQIVVVKRNTGEKLQVEWKDLDTKVVEILDGIQKEMFEKAKESFHKKIMKAEDWKGFMNYINGANIVLTPWCLNTECEKKVKEDSAIESKVDEAEREIQLTGSAKTLCIPLEQEPIKEGEKCFKCGEPAKKRVLWGRSY